MTNNETARAIPWAMDGALPEQRLKALEDFVLNYTKEDNEADTIQAALMREHKKCINWMWLAVVLLAICVLVLSIRVNSLEKKIIPGGDARDTEVIAAQLIAMPPGKE